MKHAQKYRFSFCLLGLGLISLPVTAQTEDDRSWREYDPNRISAMQVASDTTLPDTTAQLDRHGPFISNGMGSAHIERETWIDTLQHEYNRNQERPGYRIQIYRGKSSADARNVKTRFLYRRDDQRAYQNYDNVYFTVRIGNFRDKLEALKYLEEIREYYPTAYVIRDMVQPVSLPEPQIIPEDAPEGNLPDNTPSPEGGGNE